MAAIFVLACFKWRLGATCLYACLQFGTVHNVQIPVMTAQSGIGVMNKTMNNKLNLTYGDFLLSMIP